MVPWRYGDSRYWAIPSGSRRQATCCGSQTSCLLMPPQAPWDPPKPAPQPPEVGPPWLHSVTQVGLRDAAPARPRGCTTAIPPLRSSWNVRLLLAPAMWKACLSQPAWKNWEKAQRSFEGQAELIWTVRDLCNFSEGSPSGGAKWKLSPVVTVIRSMSDLLQLPVQEHLGQMQIMYSPLCASTVILHSKDIADTWTEKIKEIIESFTAIIIIPPPNSRGKGR